ncbi:MAG TPA: molybdopterin cofactor-binding domain-containing protein [Azospirillum sp.]|nr:molybdopterin cofactor-binding domain-containing protein [Azospirillum sp.]
MTAAPAQGWTGRPLPRKEDLALLTGRARFMDDLEPLPGIRHVAILRSPHPHARIRGIDISGAAALPGVFGIVTGAQIAETCRPIPSVVKTPIRFMPCAIDKVRYVGEPVAVIAAESRYVAEDALDLIEVDYEPLPGVADLGDAMAEGAPVLHDEVGSNVVNRRSFRYGNPEGAFARADHVFSFSYSYPRSLATPMETYGVIASFEGGPDRFTVWSNFQGPFVLHTLMATALKVPGNRLRLITPPASGGSFGVKQAVFPYIVLLAAASRILKAPLKWTEDRLEHLTASSAATDRLGDIKAGFSRDGELMALHFTNVVNLGAYVRAPEPASVYRMQATSNGCYRVRDIAVDNTLVVTNRVPAGLNRGYGGPQFYFALERVMDMAARELGIDPVALRRRNFIRKDEFPYHAPAGSIFDSGDYDAAMDELLRLAGYDDLKARRERAKREGRLFGIGIASGVEPSGSNMAYVTLAQTAQERAGAESKSGANSTATLFMDPMGTVTLQVSSTPNGQGHATVAAQIVADALGLEPDDIDVVTELDTRTSSWSIASGNYSNRFSAAVTSAVKQCAANVGVKLRKLAARDLDVDWQDVELAGGQARVKGGQGKGIPIAKLAARTHWNPSGLPEDVTAGLLETVVVSPPTLGSPDAEDRIASALTYGFVCDLAAVEIDRATGRVRVEKYVSVHDVGTMLNPLIVEGQVHGGFAHGLGAALLEELVHDPAGNFLSGTFADYLCPRADDVPPLVIGHVCTPSPINDTGAKGMGDGSSMTTPATIANAVADALGRNDLVLPLTADRAWALANGRTPVTERKKADTPAFRPKAGALTGEGAFRFAAPPEALWTRMLSPDVLARAIPGCREIRQVSPTRYEAEVVIRVAAIKGAYTASLDIVDPVPPRRLRLVGEASGKLGFGRGEAWIELQPEGGGTRLTYRYAADVGGTVAAVGQRVLGAVTRVMIQQFLAGLEDTAGPGGRSAFLALLRRLWRALSRRGRAS